MSDLINRILDSRHNILEIIRNDFKSAFINPIVILLLIAIIVLPSLYGLVNIYACWDPYENTDHVQFAIANEDKGALYNNTKIHAGNDLVKMLNNNTDFDWVFVTSDELRQGVHDGKYYAGIIVPANFSESIVSITTDDPHSAELEYRVNEKANPVAAKLADSAARAVYNNINAEIVTFINLAAYDKLGELQSGLASGASQMSSGAVQLSSGAGQISIGANQVSSGAQQVSSGAQQVNTGANAMANGTHLASTQADQYNAATHQATSIIRNKTSDPEINAYLSGLDQGSTNISAGMKQIDNSASSLARGTGKLQSGVDGLSEGSISLAAGAQLLANSASSALFMASSSLSSAASSLSDVTGLNDTQVGDYFYAPVKLNTYKEFKTNSFGSQVAPFYIVLSMWVGAIISCVIINRGTSIGTKYRPHEMYFGRLLLFNILAIMQTTITLLGAFSLGIDISNPIAYILSCYFVSIIFMALIYSLVSVFGDVGKGLAIILLVFQISGTGGIYPVEIMNKLFGVIYPYLPMTHAITVVREAQFGIVWANYLPSFIFLLGLGAVVILLSIVLKQRFDKRTKYFDEKLEESILFK